MRFLLQINARGGTARASLRKKPGDTPLSTHSLLSKARVLGLKVVGSVSTLVCLNPSFFCFQTYLHLSGKICGVGTKRLSGSN